VAVAKTKEMKRGTNRKKRPARCCLGLPEDKEMEEKEKKGSGPSTSVFVRG